MNGFLRFINTILSFSFVVVLLLAVVGFALHASFDAAGPLEQNAVAVVPRGETIYDIAARLEKDGIVADRRLFVAQYLSNRMLANGAAEKTAIKAGEYEIKKGASLRQVLETLVEGKAILLKFTAPEGLTSQQIAERLKADNNFTGDITQIPPEGSLLPDTYRFSRGMTRQEILDRMQAEQQKFVAQAWEKRQADLPMKTPEQALVMASIVEKETGRSDERDRVAAVFINRLRKPMRLQSDPTIVYGLVGGQGPLGRSITRSDIDSKTPYNTYQIDGLPPGPICNPGKAAIEATLNPAKTQDLYFVADGSGGHTFTSTLKDHNAAVQNWRRIERERGKPVAAEPASAPAEAAAEAPPAPPVKTSTPSPAAKKNPPPKKQ